MKAEQGIEVHIGLVHHIEGIRLRLKYIQLVTVMPSAICDVDACRNTSPQTQQGMHLYGSLAVFAQCPRCQLDTGGYGCGVKSIKDIIHSDIRYGGI